MNSPWAVNVINLLEDFLTHCRNPLIFSKVLSIKSQLSTQTREVILQKSSEVSEVVPRVSSATQEGCGCGAVRLGRRRPPD